MENIWDNWEHLTDTLCSRHFFETRMAQEVSLEPLGDEWAGYKAIVTGGNDKQGFPMKQVSRCQSLEDIQHVADMVKGVLTPQRVRLLLGKGHSCFRERRAGSKRRKSVRGCIVSNGQYIAWYTTNCPLTLGSRDHRPCLEDQPARRGRYPRTHRHRPPSTTRTQEGYQNSTILQLVQG